MKRRAVLSAIAAVALAPRAHAQAAKRARIALVDPGEQAANIAEGRNPYWSVFFVELRRLGLVEGQNLVVERWTAGGVASAEGYTELARKAVASAPRLLVVRGMQTSTRVARETKEIPIIAIGTIAPHLRESLGRPGKNLTGFHLSFDALQLYSKQIEMLSALLKPAPRIAWLGSKIAWDGSVGEAARKGATGANVVLHPVFVPNPITRAAIRRAFAEIAQAKVDGLLISPVVELFPHRITVTDLAAMQRLPSLGINRYWADAGALIGYGVDYDEIYRRVAGYVERILKGADPGAMPIQMPDKIELVINLQTAREIGVAIPQGMLVRADRVIQ
jgi:putative ABC transport system substrate-binding protein